MRDFFTADLSDEHREKLGVVPLIQLRHFGGNVSFSGRIETVSVEFDNSLIRETLQSNGFGRVLVVDGHGLEVALLGDRLATFGIENNWAGVIINGCVRDSARLAKMPIGIVALGTTPQRSFASVDATVSCELTFLNTTISPGHWLYADEDGIVVSQRQLV